MDTAQAWIATFVYGSRLLATKRSARRDRNVFKAHGRSGQGVIAGEACRRSPADFLASGIQPWKPTTICFKVQCSAVTAVGLDLKVLDRQFGEQVKKSE